MRPAFRGPIFGTGHHGHDAAISLDTEFAHSLLLVVFRYRQFGIRQDIRQYLVNVQSERNKTFNGLVQHFRVESTHVINDTETHFTAESGTYRNLRKPGYER
jgi:hypothetical protein